MEVFISQPMDGLTNDEIKQRRLEIFNMIKRRYPTKEFRLVANPLIANLPHDDNLIIWYLGKSLEYIASADLVFFSKDWEVDYICSLEHTICHYYNIPIMYEDGYSTHESVYYHYDANISPLKGDN